MEIETKVISMETIKPSSSTPQKHQLSLLDQPMPPILTPWIYLYQWNPQISNTQRSNQLKKSLSEVLSVFYPLAGTLVGNHYVDCNDGGVPFFEAEANCHLSQLNPYQNHMTLDKLLPYKMEEPQPFCLAVQATFFRCGGLALGILISHKLADACSVVMFIKAWAAAARNEDHYSREQPQPKFDTAAYFPPLQDTSGIYDRIMITKEEIATKVLTFPAATISRLRERYSDGGRRLSRVVALSAYIWTQFISATGAGSDPNKIHIVAHPVDIRGRVDPPLSEHQFGNIVGASFAMPSADDAGPEVARKIEDAVKAVSKGHVTSADTFDNQFKEMMVMFSFSSLCGFPLYEVDFGWGKPVWVGLGWFAFKNTVFFTETPSGGGIEAFLHLTKQDMVKFEALVNNFIINSNL